MTLSLDTAYRSFGGEVEASSTPTICRPPDSRRHQFWAIALLNRLTAQLSLVELDRGQVLAEADRRIYKVYFPHSGIISCIVELSSGNAIETGLIGNDGAFGAGHAFDDRVSLNRVVVQATGMISVISSDR